ncbi:MAG: hypothetical protein HRF43_14705, partial [Phycisphaerae bacterium]
MAWFAVALPCAAGGPATGPAAAPATRPSAGPVGTARPWLPPDVGPAAAAAVERKAASLMLDRNDQVDLDDPRAVFAYVFRSIPAQVTARPSENYLYWRFHARDKFVWGNMRLEPTDRYDGKVHFGYYEFREELTGPEEANVRYREFGPADGVRVDKVDDFNHAITADGRTVAFAFHRLPLHQPLAFPLPDDEVFVFRTLDESGVGFHLLFNTRTRNFLFVADEDEGPLDQIVAVGDRLALDAGTGFLFYVDAARNERKILIGVYRRNTQQNNYYDGPADQLADNYMREVPEYKHYLHAAYPFTRGVIDDHGFYVYDAGNRVAVAPYYTYTSLEEVRGMMAVCGRHENVGDVLSCLIPGGWHEESERTTARAGDSVEPLAGLPGVMGIPALIGAGTLAGGAALNGPVFHEDWEGPDPLGAGGWTASGLWHLTKDPPTHCPPEGNYKSAVTSAYYGQDPTCNYDNGGRNFGFLTSPVIPNLPDNAFLSFWQRHQTENDLRTHQYDTTRVEISVDGGPFTLLYETFDETNKWVKVGPLTLNAYAGKNIQIRFAFDTVDNRGNGFLGWMVDDIDITTGVAGGGLGGIRPPRHMFQVTWH